MSPQASFRSPHWDQVYSRRDHGSLSWFQARPTESLQRITALTSPGAGIVDVGAGVSALPRHLLALGYADLTVLDLSATALATLEQDTDRAVQTIHADLCTWVPQRTWDLWHDRAVLHFLRDEPCRRAYAAALRRSLLPGGHAVISTFAPDGPERCSDLPVRRYGAEELIDLVGRQHFELVEHQRLVHPKPRGGQQRFQLSVLRRR